MTYIIHPNEEHDYFEKLDSRRDELETEGQKRDRYEEEVRKELVLGDIDESLNYLTSEEQFELMKAYREQQWLDISHYHEKAMDLYVKRLTQMKMEKDQ